MTGSSSRLSIRIDLENGFRLGPGQIALLERVARLGSISAAGRDMNMSYRRAWQLVDEINGIFGTPVVVPKSGGRNGGGAELTALGKQLVDHYHRVAAAAADAAEPHIRAIEKALRS